MKPFTCGSGSGSVPVVTPRFSKSCGIDTGSNGAERYNHLSVFGRGTRITSAALLTAGCISSEIACLEGRGRL
jgi:hypothetical protein